MPLLCMSTHRTRDIPPSVCTFYVQVVFNVKTNKKITQTSNKKCNKTQEWPNRKSRQTRWEWQLDFVSRHKLIMHSHDVTSLYNYTYLCAWCQCPQKKCPNDSSSCGRHPVIKLVIHHVYHTDSQLHK